MVNFGVRLGRDSKSRSGSESRSELWKSSSEKPRGLKIDWDLQRGHRKDLSWPCKSVEDGSENSNGSAAT